MKSFKVFLERNLQSQDELKQIYKNLIPHFKDRTLLLFRGPVGAGKTTSIRILAELLGMNEESASPSFAIHHRYENKSREVMDHVDLYRLKDDEDLESTGFWDLFRQSKSVICVEWADRLHEEALPLNWQEIRIQLSLISGQENFRNIKIEIQN